MFRFSIGFVAVSLISVGMSAGAAVADELASHRAIYDLALDPSVDSGDIGEVSGRVVTEFTGSSCSGYKASMRFVMAIENEDGDKQITDTRSVSFEDSGGSTLDFSNQTYVDDKLTSDRAARPSARQGRHRVAGEAGGEESRLLDRPLFSRPSRSSRSWQPPATTDRSLTPRSMTAPTTARRYSRLRL